MNPILRNFGSALAGLITGSLLNGMIIRYSHWLIPPPPGVDLTTEAGLQNAMQVMEPIHFLMPFLAHALGTLAGAMLAARLSNAMRPSMSIGILFLLGGIYMVKVLPSPLWFNVLDLSLAYLPMAWLGFLLGRKKMAAGITKTSPRR
jgi:hypothetical protein